MCGFTQTLESTNAILFELTQPVHAGPVFLIFWTLDLIGGRRNAPSLVVLWDEPPSSLRNSGGSWNPGRFRSSKWLRDSVARFFTSAAGQKHAILQPGGSRGGSSSDYSGTRQVSGPWMDSPVSKRCS